MRSRCTSSPAAGLSWLIPGGTRRLNATGRSRTITRPVGARAAGQQRDRDADDQQHEHAEHRPARGRGQRRELLAQRRAMFGGDGANSVPDAEERLEVVLGEDLERDHRLRALDPLDLGEAVR